MEIVLGVAVVIAVAVGLLFLVDRRNPGTFRKRDSHAEDGPESGRKQWLPR